MNPQLKKKFSELINKYGLWQASKNLSMTPDELLDLAGHTIENPIDAGDLISYMLESGKLQGNYKNFKIFYNKMEGTISWYYTMYDIELDGYATPFWENYEGIPLNLIIFKSGDEIADEFETIYTSYNFGSSDEVKKWWEEFYLPKVYKKIKYLTELNGINLD